MAKAHGSHPAGAMVESAVRVGYRPPQTLLEPGRFTDLRHVLQRAEEIGVDHLCTGDHVSFHGGTGFDGLVQATAFAMLTERLPVHISVYQLPLRHPVLVARQPPPWPSWRPNDSCSASASGERTGPRRRRAVSTRAPVAAAWTRA